MHYGFSLFGILPQSAAGSSPQSTERFAIDYTFWLNLAFLAATGVLAWLRFGGAKKQQKQHQKHNNDGGGCQHHGGGHDHRTAIVLASYPFLCMACWGNYCHFIPIVVKER